VLTTGAPVAGKGVTQKLLGTVNRAGLGEQVTYGGHPLYLFDQGAGQITGEGWDEPTLPPWHGLWYLVTPAAQPLAWPGTLTTLKVKNKTVLAALVLTGAGWTAAPLYSFSADTSSKSNCTASCSVAWPPALSSGRPALLNSVSSSKVGTIPSGNGGSQLTYGDKPLYFDANEGVGVTAAGFAMTGSGGGQKAPAPASGSFSLVAP